MYEILLLGRKDKELIELYSKIEFMYAFHAADNETDIVYTQIFRHKKYVLFQSINPISGSV